MWRRRPDGSGVWGKPEEKRPFPHLDVVLHLHVSQQLAVDAEETEVSLVIVDHAVALGGGLDEPGPQAALWALQGPEQVSVHGMDQARTLYTQGDTELRLI